MITWLICWYACGWTNTAMTCRSQWELTLFEFLLCLSGGGLLLFIIAINILWRSDPIIWRRRQ